MSRTDKDVPYRVHVRRRGTEGHDHRSGVCDFTPAERERAADSRGLRFIRYTCGLEINGRYLDTLKYYGGRSSVYSFWQTQLKDEDNSRVRKDLGDVKKLHRAGEDVEFEDVPNYQHRHSAAWEVW